MTSKETRGQLLRVVGTLASLGLLAYLVSQQGWHEIWESIRRISIGRFLIVLGLVILSRLAVVGRWSALLWLSHLRIPLPQILRVTFAGMFASNFLPTSVGGDIVRLAWTVGVPADRSKYASSIAVDRLIGLVGMAMLLPVGLVQVLGPGAVSSAGGLAPLVAGTVTPSRLLVRVRRALRGVLDLMGAWLSNPKALAVALGFTWIHMTLMFSSMSILYQALGESLTFWQIGGLWSFVYFISLFPISINSLGLMEVSAGLVYSSIGGAAVSSALTVALLKRTAELLASSPGVLSLPGVLALIRRPAVSERTGASE